jgi:hypothetical protein
MRLSLAKTIILEGIKKNLAQKSNHKPISFHLEGSWALARPP